MLSSAPCVGTLAPQSNNALQLTRAPVLQKVRAARHFVPHRAGVINGPSQLNAVFYGRVGSPVGRRG
jgi:hypothetical protein